MKRSTYTAEEFATAVGLTLLTGGEGLWRPISGPEAHRPGLALAGYLKGFPGNRVLVFGRAEVGYLAELSDQVRFDRLSPLLTERVPAVVMSRDLAPPESLYDLCKARHIPLFSTSMRASHLMAKVNYTLAEEFAPVESRHGTLVEVHGVGIFIEGESAAGKSEAALGLIERGHKLIADDVVLVKRTPSNELVGDGVEVTRYHMEVRGIGIINVADLYGAVCVREKHRLDVVVRLESWNGEFEYDRVGLEQQMCEILDVEIPFHLLPVKPGRDVVLLLETIALQHRLKQMGCHAAAKLDERLKKMMAGGHR